VTEQRITSRKNPLLQQVKKLLSSKKTREEAGLFVADGTKLLQEAVKYCPGLDTVILSDGVEAEVPEKILPAYFGQVDVHQDEICVSFAQDLTCAREVADVLCSIACFFEEDGQLFAQSPVILDYKNFAHKCVYEKKAPEKRIPGTFSLQLNDFKVIVVSLVV
jgi:hypothetical protein